MPLRSGAFCSLPLTLTDNSNQVDHANQLEAMQCESKRRTNNIDPCKLSLEYLQLIGVPVSLCRLIYNMLDGIHGTFADNECYSDITSVMFDLKLMQQKPHFLHNLDMEKLSTGLQCSDNIFSREEEFISLQSCYFRSISGGSEPVIIVGDSGTGKTHLANRLGSFIRQQGGVFISGKFDMMQQAKPFSALACAFDQYCDILLNNFNADWVQVVVKKLDQTLGENSRHLIQLLPKLSQILAATHHNGSNHHGVDSMHTLQRLCYLICQFVDIISKYSPISVTLFLDDVQWGDEATISVLNQLLINRNKRFFFLGCCRSADGDVDEDHSFWKTIRHVGSFGANTTIIQLECMKKETLGEMVSDMLCLSPRITKSLSEILWSKTKGNPFFVSQLLLSLNRDGLLRLSLSKQRWIWDEEEILSMKLPEDIAICL